MLKAHKQCFLCKGHMKACHVPQMAPSPHFGHPWSMLHVLVWSLCLSILKMLCRITDLGRMMIKSIWSSKNTFWQKCWLIKLNHKNILHNLMKIKSFKLKKEVKTSFKFECCGSRSKSWRCLDSNRPPARLLKLAKQL